MSSKKDDSNIEISEDELDFGEPHVNSTEVCQVDDTVDKTDMTVNETNTVTKQQGCQLDDSLDETVQNLTLEESIPLEDTLHKTDLIKKETRPNIKVADVYRFSHGTLKLYKQS